MPLTSTFSTIAATQTAADKPLDTTLMDAMRQDIDVLYEWMGGPTYTPSTSHDHDGINSKAVRSGLIFLASATAAASATVDFTSGLSTVYDEYEIHVVNALPAVDNDSLYLRIGTGVGPTYETTLYYWATQDTDAAGTELNAGGGNVAFVNISGSAGVDGAASNAGFSGVIKCFNPQSTSIDKAFTYSGAFFGTAGDTFHNLHGAGMRDSTSAATAFRLLYAAGNITSGRFYFYGVQRT